LKFEFFIIFYCACSDLDAMYSSFSPASQTLFPVLVGVAGSVPNPFPRVGGRGRKCALPATPTNTGKRVWLARLLILLVHMLRSRSDHVAAVSIFGE